MKLQEILKNIPYQGEVEHIEVHALARDSRQVEKGSLFFCIPGVAVDGHQFAHQALEQGAAGIVVERDLGLSNQILVENSHVAYGIACGNYYGNPSEKLKLIAVTGTNGKTTITYIVKGILEANGKKTGLIGTIENQIGDVVLQAKHTTPDPYQLHALFARMVQAGCEYVVMEASSHALDQHRMAGCHVVAGGFTNLTQDHLDYHGSMEAYFGAKKKLFAMSDTAIVNADDEHGRILAEVLEGPVFTFSCKEKMGDLYAKDISFSESGSSFKMCYNDSSIPVSFIQPGLFSISNALCASGLCMAAGLSFEEVAKGLENCPHIPGRFEKIPTQTDYTVIRDFAHSADGLEKLLSTVKEFVKGRVVTLFGCAGERDRKKRKLMSATAAKYSDFCILTADNPRSEPIDQIHQDALPGFLEYDTPYKIFSDRFEAIIWALEHSQPQDFLILAGKGHEDYQVLDFGSINFNEKEIVIDLLQRMEQGERWE